MWSLQAKKRWIGVKGSEAPACGSWCYYPFGFLCREFVRLTGIQASSSSLRRTTYLRDKWYQVDLTSYSWWSIPFPPWYSFPVVLSVVLGPAAAAPGDLLEMQIPGPHSRFIEQETVSGAQQSVLVRPPGDCDSCRGLVTTTIYLLSSAHFTSLPLYIQPWGQQWAHSRCPINVCGNKEWIIKK